MNFLLLQIDKAPGVTVEYAGKLKNIAVEYLPKFVLAVVVYIIGSWLIGKLSKTLSKIMMAKNYDPSLQSFLHSFIKVMLTILLLLTVAGMIGVNLTAFGALIAGLAVGVGAALNGTLGNFAGGVMMLIFKPFKVGDIIEAQGQMGVVKEQGVFNTILLSPENKTIILPNGALSTGTIVNFNTHGTLRVDLTMAIGLQQDIQRAREVAIEAMLSHPDVLKQPMPEVNVLKIADFMTTLAIRPYTTQESYWSVYFGVQELVKNAWDKHGIKGPVNARVIINQ